jgi:molybdopterin converting factor subunit 1
MTGRVAVRVFARLRELAGAEVIYVPVPAGATADDVRRAVEVLYPDAKGLLAKCAVAVNNEYAAADQPIRDGDEVALIPPVSGG